MAYETITNRDLKKLTGYSWKKTPVDVRDAYLDMVEQYMRAGHKFRPRDIHTFDGIEIIEHRPGDDLIDLKHRPSRHKIIWGKGFGMLGDFDDYLTYKGVSRSAIQRIIDTTKPDKSPPPYISRPILEEMEKRGLDINIKNIFKTNTIIDLISVYETLQHTDGNIARCGSFIKYLSDNYTIMELENFQKHLNRASLTSLFHSVVRKELNDKIDCKDYLEEQVKSWTPLKL